MRFKKIKLIVALFGAVFLLFFSNDFGLIDVEKTAIITAVSIDKSEDGKYKVTAQIAVPEATDSNTENMRAQISGTGYTVGGAIKNIGDTSGWFPQLAFCNLIIVGKSFKDENLIKILDYFSKTLRIQDSALVVMADGEGVDLLKLSSPLDNISSFALQKIILKNAGLNRDVATCDIKRFCADYYDISSSCYMPLISVISQKSENEKGSAEDLGDNGDVGGNGGSGGNGGKGGNGGSPEQSGGAKGDAIFDANRTALFKNGKSVGELDKDLTCAFNALRKDFSSTTVEINGVEIAGKEENFLLTVFSADAKTRLFADDSGLTYTANLNIFAKISDRTSDYSDADYVKNLPLPTAVKEKAESVLKSRIEDLIRTEIQTDCDFLGIKKELYKKHNSFYSKYK
ncbi:MAG: hypothetical protein IJQ66_02205, partial [Clostridia bacterium]|nr:hypothetical protein [Clostridia bacterium]